MSSCPKCFREINYNINGCECRLDDPLLSDAELVALAALGNAERMIMAGDNEMQRLKQLPPRWYEGAGMPPACMRLSEELIKRGILK